MMDPTAQRYKQRVITPMRPNHRDVMQTCHGKEAR